MFERILCTMQFHFICQSVQAVYLELIMLITSIKYLI